MAAQHFDRALALVLAHEGGYVDHPRDPGGATNRGVTQATLAAHRGRAVSKAEVRALSRAEAAAIYRRGYWDAVRGDDLAPGVDLVVFDLAINSGPTRAAKILQRALGVPEDGAIGPVTLSALARADPGALIAAVTRERLKFLQRLPTWTAFGRGWRRRVAAVEQESRALLRTDAEPAVTPHPQPQKGQTMTDHKPIAASKTVWANLVGLACVALAAVGVDTGGVDTDRFAESVAQLVAAASFIASTVFRITASKQLAG